MQLSLITEPVLSAPPLSLAVGRDYTFPTLSFDQGGAPVRQPASMTMAFPTASSYKQYDQRTHVYQRPDMYIGGDERSVREDWLYDYSQNRMVSHQLDLPPGCERLFLEIVSNASDNMGRSRRAGVDPGAIEVTADNRTVSVKNYGLPIPIELHPQSGVYVPTMIFGSLLTSSNYEVDRHDAGTNGIGAKATNIFSTRFSLQVEDHVRHLTFSQTWQNNMTQVGEPVITPFAGSRSSVTVTYEMDFLRFGYPAPSGPSGGYPPEALALFARHVIDTSFTAKVPVSFNGQQWNFSATKDYARLYFGDKVSNAIVHYQWPPGTEVQRKRSGYQTSATPGVVPEIELLALDTPDAGAYISFVNCLMTRDGGVHVNAALKAVGDVAVKLINEAVVKKLTKGGKTELGDKEKKARTISITDVKPHISLLLSVRVTNPKYTSQSKTVLHSPTPKFEIADETLRPVARWQLIDRLYATIDAKQFASQAKTDGRLKGYVSLAKGIDANQAGKKQRDKCVLYITEGRSGASYANKLVGLVPGGRDYIGVLPMRGKGLNVMKADRIQIEKNLEITELKKMLGLMDCPDPVLRSQFYLDEANFNKLRYRWVMIMADSDDDGKHIIGLLLNLFHCRFPSLLARGYLMYYQTPTLRVTLGNRVEKFYSNKEYREWRERTPSYRNWKHKYYKGLGTSKDSEIKDDFSTPRVVTCFYDADAPRAVQLAFDKKFTHQRKEWIRAWNPTLEVDAVQMQPISHFIHHDLITFSVANVQRSIPRLTDGFKESHRKIVHAAHLKWNVGPRTNYQEIKVAQLGAFVAERTNYHHGEMNLDDVIVGMAQDFTGANNLPWFARNGQFGTRYQGGKDAAETRYSHTQPERLMAFILRKEDRPILVHREDEGESVEPVTYWPVIPMILVNGSKGIGTGYSTFIPSHNPLVVIAWVKARLRGAPLPALVPWFRGFTGETRVVERRARGSTADDEEGELLPTEDPDEEEEEETTVSTSQKSVVTKGRFSVNPIGTITITELPIGRWAYNYHKWLEQLVEKKMVLGFCDRSVDNGVYFEITGFAHPPNHRSLKLQRSMGLTNMVLLDENGIPTHYDSAAAIAEAFFLLRLPVYEARKRYCLEQLDREIVELGQRVRFIRAVISKEIKILRRPKAEILAAMARLQLPAELLNKTRLSNCTEDEVQELLAKAAAKEAERNQLAATPSAAIWEQELEELEREYRTQYQEEMMTLALPAPASVPPPSAVSSGPVLTLI